MKEKELRENAICTRCGLKIGAAGPLFWSGTVECHIMDIQAMQRQQGLAMFLGGNGLLASVMGPNEDMTKLLRTRRIVVCGNCEKEFLQFLDHSKNEEEDEA